MSASCWDTDNQIILGKIFVSEEEFFKQKREHLVFYMQSTLALKTESVKKAFLAVKRELFMPGHLKEQAYADDAMPIGFNQTISQPSTIAVMLEMLEAKDGQKILEVGSGSGYVCALLSYIVGEKGRVFGVEIVPELVDRAKKSLELQGCKNVEIIKSDGSLGLKEKAPFDRILVSAACPFIPKPLLEQLKDDGIAVAPVGDRYTQMMEQLRKTKKGFLKQHYLQSYFVFVPLKGEHGWKQ